MVNRRHFLTAAITLVLLGFSACGSGNNLPAPQPDEQAFRAGINEHQPPQGVDAPLWQSLNSELDRVLGSLGTTHSTSGAPLDTASRGLDLQVSAAAGSGAVFTFSYRNTGDYDQNGEVNISDLTPLGINFHLNPADAAWPAAQVADGDANGEINIADITPIGLYYGNRVEGFMLQSAPDPASASWQDIDDMPLSGGSRPPAGGFLLMGCELSDTAGDAWFRVAPYLHNGSAHEFGIPSTTVFFGLDALAAPENLVASMGAYEDHVSLTWNSTSGATGYQIFRDNQNLPLAVQGDVNSYSDFELSDTAPHSYWVRALDATRISNFSSTASGWLAPVSSALDPPANVQASDGLYSDHVYISWNKSPGALSYEIYRDNQSSLLTTAGDSGFYNDYSLNDSLAHTYWVVALNDSERSVYSNSDTGYRGTQPTGTMLVLGYNDLGMHCMNEDFSEFMILPPYNTLHATIIDRSGEAPRLVNSGLTVRYTILDNTYSVGKSNFWDYALPLLGADLAPNIGLSGHGLAGTMEPSLLPYPDWVVTGIPLTPINDAGVEDAYPLANISVFKNGVETASTLAVTPVSWEISCNICHNTQGISTATDILRRHDVLHGTDLENSKPVTCGICHAQPELGLAGVGGVPTLSSAMHSAHATRMGDLNLTTACYACHPGNRTQCLRDVHFSKGLSCQACHGTMADVGNPIRRPWQDEPRCDDCHSRAGYEFEQPDTLYRDSVGHKGIHCAACHGSPHAITPTVVSNDNLQAIATQGYPGVINKCSVCHNQDPGQFEHFYEAGDD